MVVVVVALSSNGNGSSGKRLCSSGSRWYIGVVSPDHASFGVSDIDGYACHF